MNLIPTDRESAQRWALHWIAAWNAHDIEAVLLLFADDCAFRSPKAHAVTGRGTVHGKAALRAYWTQALAGVNALLFRFESVHWDAAARTLVLRYIACLGEQRVIAAEIFDFDAYGLVIRGTALYGAPAD